MEFGGHGGGEDDGGGSGAESLDDWVSRRRTTMFWGKIGGSFDPKVGSTRGIEGKGF